MTHTTHTAQHHHHRRRRRQPRLRRTRTWASVCSTKHGNVLNVVAFKVYGDVGGDAHFCLNAQKTMSIKTKRGIVNFSNS